MNFSRADRRAVIFTMGVSVAVLAYMAYSFVLITRTTGNNCCVVDVSKSTYAKGTYPGIGSATSIAIPFSLLLEPDKSANEERSNLDLILFLNAHRMMQVSANLDYNLKQLMWNRWPPEMREACFAALVLNKDRPEVLIKILTMISQTGRYTYSPKWSPSA